MSHVTYMTRTNYVDKVAIGWRRPLGYLIFIGHFPQKSPIIDGSFAENDCEGVLHLKTKYELFMSPMTVST